MLRGLKKRIYGLRRPVCQVLLAACLIPKLLIPTGYMPAALASGSLLMLCDAVGAIPAVGSAATAGQAMGHRQHPASHAAEHAGSMADISTAFADAQPMAAADMSDMPHGEDDDEHNEWKRCSLGSLAATAAITSDWQLPSSDHSHERILTAAPLAASTLRRTGFQSRAPPPA